MAYELFDRNLAVEMTLGEAVAKGILPTHIYVPIWYDYDDKLKQYQEDIALITDRKEREALSHTLKQLKNNLQLSYGAEDVFATYMPNNYGKYIVFCRDYKHLQEMQGAMQQWLCRINPCLRFYVSISREKDRDLQLEAFKADNGYDAIKLLFTVDRLNEGLHVKDIDGVIMLRPTTSPIIYLQ
jgi:superfamily II DNA or RNA helicase